MPIITSATTADESYLFKVPIPLETRTYKPVSHHELVEGISKSLDKASFGIVEKKYGYSDHGNVMLGKFIANDATKSGEYPRVQNFVMFMNSYNKTRALRFAFGTIYDGKYPMISSGVNFRKKHVGSIQSELDEILNRTSMYLATDYQDVMYQQQLMEHIKVSITHAIEMTGTLFIKVDLLNTPQLNQIKQALIAKINDGKELISLWDYYTIVENQLKETHAVYQIDKYIDLFTHIKEHYGLY